MKIAAGNPPSPLATRLADNPRPPALVSNEPK
jgi:hypothetical protein